MKGVKRYEVAGTPYKYHRTTGIPLPTDVPESHPAFLAAYMAAEETAKQPQRIKSGPGSIEAVWNAYLRSDAHKGLSASYRRVRERDGAKLVMKAGHVPLRHIKATHIVKDMAALEPHPANERRKTWRALMAFAVAEGFRTDNPAEAVKRRATGKAEPHTPWSPADIEAFRRTWPVGSQERLAFELLHWTGARMSDAIRMGEGMVDADGWLTFRQQKTGGEVSIPLRRNVPEIADPADLRALIECLTPGHMTWLVTAYGASRSQKAASQWFAATARKAGIEGKTAHGLRKTRAIKLAERGATTHQIGAWTGHETLKEIERYSRAADRRRLLSGPEGEQKMSKARGD